MVLVKGGEFMMGCSAVPDSICKANEKPLHKVKVASFYISKFEVTQAQYEFVMSANPAHHKNCPNCPVEEVSWDDAQAFISKLNEMTHLKYRLPTEAEWEYAARGGTKSKGYIYSGNNDLEKAGWYNGNSTIISHPVGFKQPNEIGLFDMSGNVAEWCSDWFLGNYYGHSAKNKVHGPDKGKERVVRGGSWDFIDDYCRNSYRLWNGPTYKNNYTGFRLVRDE